jgi:FixJ family two-component response regulator
VSLSDKRPLVAVVDDDPAICKAVGRLISKSKFDAVTFTSGQKLLDLLQVRRPDCLLLDLHMPGLSGLDVLRIMADAGTKLPTIIITGRDEQTSHEQCLAAGALAILLKPLAPSQIQRAIDQALGRRAAGSSFRTAR